MHRHRSIMSDGASGESQPTDEAVDETTKEVGDYDEMRVEMPSAEAHHEAFSEGGAAETSHEIPTTVAEIPAITEESIELEKPAYAAIGSHIGDNNSIEWTSTDEKLPSEDPYTSAEWSDETIATDEQLVSESESLESTPEPVDPSEIEQPTVESSEFVEAGLNEQSDEPTMTRESVEPTPAEIDGMLLGTVRDSSGEGEGAAGPAEQIVISSDILARHAAMLGSTGSGKTVMAKTLIEEATIAGIPSLIVDPQGDLARLCLGVDEETLTAKGGRSDRRQAFLDKAEVRIWTPLRSKGLPICIDPFQTPPDGLDLEEAITAWDMVAAGFTSLADYDMDKPQGKQARTFLYEILVHGTRLGLDLSSFRSLAEVVREPEDTFLAHLAPAEESASKQSATDGGEAGDGGKSAEEKGPTWAEIAVEHDLPEFDEMLATGTRHEMSRRLAACASGVNQLLFSNGVNIDIDTFKTPSVEGKVPINVLYLNTIQDDSLKQYVVQELSRTLYDWMLSQQTTDGDLNLLFFMDEVAPYLPPHPRNPPAKDLIKLIFKQARKYGVSCVLATQNPSDVDYKILAQANTMFVGRFTTPQDIDKVRHMLKEGGGDQTLVDDLPTLKAGEFQLVCPDASDAPIPLQCRWLYSDHGAPFTEDEVEEHTSDELRAWAKSRTGASSRARGAGAAAIAASGVGSAGATAAASGGENQDGTGSDGSSTSGFSGMSASAQGTIDESGFEVRLMGGLSVLKDGRDPMYVMQSVTNAASTAVLIWTMIALIIEWNGDLLEWYWALLAFSITSAVVLVVSLDLFLSHDAQLQQKISKFSRTIQYGLAAWLWSLHVWSNSSGGPNLHGAGMLLEMVVVWVTLFVVVEIANRVKLGRLKFAKGFSALDTLKKGVGSLTAVLTRTEISEMQTSSQEVMRGLRWVLDFATLTFFVAITAFTIGGTVTLAAALGSLPNTINADAYIVKPAFWLGSLYLLLFIAESWMRVRDHSAE